MSTLRPSKTIAEPFPLEAVNFVRAGLEHTVKHVHGERDDDADDQRSRHVSGAQLCLGLRDYAYAQYGRLAGCVLRHWGIRSTRDFGRIVFAMIDAGLLRKSDEDSLDHFDHVYDFDEAFGPVFAR